MATKLVRGLAQGRGPEAPTRRAGGPALGGRTDGDVSGPPLEGGGSPADVARPRTPRGARGFSEALARRASRGAARGAWQEGGGASGACSSYRAQRRHRRAG